MLGEAREENKYLLNKYIRANVGQMPNQVFAYKLDTQRN